MERWPKGKVTNTLDVQDQKFEKRRFIRRDERVIEQIPQMKKKWTSLQNLKIIFLDNQ